MRNRRWFSPSGQPTPIGRRVAFLLGLLVVFGIATALPSLARDLPAAPQLAHSLPSAQNSSSDPSSTPPSTSALCPGGGPVILGVEWTCVAVLDLTELILILVSIGIVAYVFRDADRAELPGDSAEVPITAAEWEEYRRAKKEGLPYSPPPPENRPGKE